MKAFHNLDASILSKGHIIFTCDGILIYVAKQAVEAVAAPGGSVDLLLLEAPAAAVVAEPGGRVDFELVAEAADSVGFASPEEVVGVEPVFLFVQM